MKPGFRLAADVAGVEMQHGTSTLCNAERMSGLIYTAREMREGERESVKPKPMVVGKYRNKRSGRRRWKEKSRQTLRPTGIDRAVAVKLLGTRVRSQSHRLCPAS